jgi:hypothetical protein
LTVGVVFIFGDHSNNKVASRPNSRSHQRHTGGGDAGGGR